MEERGFEPRASRMRSERSTTELHPPTMEAYERGKRRGESAADRNRGKMPTLVTVTTMTTMNRTMAGPGKYNPPCALLLQLAG